MFNKRIALFFVSAFLMSAMLAGCAGPTQVLINQKYASGRVVRYTIEPSGESTEDSGQLFNMRVRLCDLASDGSTAESRCQDSMVIENVQPRSVY